MRNLPEGGSGQHTKPMTKTSKNFIILVEMVERELPAGVLLGSELADRGHTVWLIEKGRFRKSPASFEPSIVLEKGLTTGCLPRYRAMRAAGHVLAVMCQEGFTYRSGEDYVERRVWGETLKCVDYLFLWGERQTKDMEAFLPDVRGYYVTGSPRFDILHPRFHGCWEAQVAELKRTYGDFVLFTSRFGAVNHFRRSFDQTVDRRMEIYTGEAVQSAPQRFQFLRQLFLDYMDVVQEIATRFPDQKFIVRPHPLEDPDTWRSHLADVGNVHVRDGGSPIPWLSAARCVVHSACTTGIEAYILKTPVTEYYPGAIPRSELDPALPGEVTGACHSVDELAQWIKTHTSQHVVADHNAASDDLIAQHLQNARHPAAYAEMAAAMENFRGPRPWAKILNKVSRERVPGKMKKRYIELDEVNGFLQSYVDCHVRDRFVPAVVDEVGIKLRVS